MNDSSTPMGNQSAAQNKPPLTAAQKALLEHKVLPLNSLVHGAYYNGFLDDDTTVGRWHAEKHRFVFWEYNVSLPGSKATPHVADLGTGARFAPLALQESAEGFHISDFALETTR